MPALLCFTTLLDSALLLHAGALQAQNPYLLAYLRRLLKGPPEHNWGLSVGQFLPELRTVSGNWSNELFAAARARLRPQTLVAEGLAH